MLPNGEGFRRRFLPNGLASYTHFQSKASGIGAPCSPHSDPHLFFHSASDMLPRSPANTLIKLQQTRQDYLLTVRHSPLLSCSSHWLNSVATTVTGIRTSRVRDFILFYVFVSIQTSKIIIIQVTQTALRIQENYYNSEKSPTFFPFKVLKCLYNLTVVITGVSSRLFWIETVF